MSQFLNLEQELNEPVKSYSAMSPSHETKESDEAISCLVLDMRERKLCLKQSIENF
jgi:hypothetical protein